ncbi:MAG: mono/diheme cytochrome c family protein [Pirellulaceae bacterium]|jgi:mono/diheme cytochrome c family protein
MKSIAFFPLVVVLLFPQAIGSADDTISYEKEIRPILAEKCFHCHGPDPKQRKADLRLDTRAGVLADLDGHTAIVPGKPEASELFRRITTDDLDERMPPQDSKKILTEVEIGAIKKWLEQGAAYGSHWAYRAIVQPAEPAVKDETWRRNVIDRFVSAQHDLHGLAPAPEADRYTLIKRLYYDLLGLPPTPAEADAFVSDKSPLAYETVVDRLLDSPQFGEHWGRSWLDKARYADSDGYEKDNTRPNAWHYRDWVVNAINDDMPFDQFTIEQLAGDLLPNATESQQLATAFHRQTLTNTEGGSDQEEFRIEATFDRTETTAAIWLGLTVGCARCHSHKYDQIDHSEYYQLFAFFNNTDEANMNVASSPEAMDKYQKDKATYDLEIGNLTRQLNEAKTDLETALTVWEAEIQKKLAASNTAKFHDVEVLKLEAKDGVTFQKKEDGSYLAMGPNPPTNVYSLLLKTDVKEITGIRLEVLADASLGAGGPGRAGHGNFVLNEIVVRAADSAVVPDDAIIKLPRAKADHSQADWDAQTAINGRKDRGWAVAPQFNKNHYAIFFTEKPIQFPGTTWLQVTLDQYHGTQHTIGRFRLSVMTGNDVEQLVPDAIRQILAVKAEERSEPQRQSIRDHFATQYEPTSKLVKAIAELKKKEPKAPVVNLRVLRERTARRETRVLQRGNFQQPAEAVVLPGGLKVLHTLSPMAEGTQPNRMDLASWLTSDANPLTPRVAVNHIWSQLFGKGIVRSVNDFGIRGERPTHPKLLDWLATDLMRSGWSRKRMIKQIVTSATYRQSSRLTADLLEEDPDNQFLARQNRFRVSAETVRDISLSAAGLLSKKMGGPSVFPPMSAEVAALSYANNFGWKNSVGEDRYRRGLYTFRKRTAPHPNLATFDCPDANLTALSRQTSNTPLQALVTLNNEIFVEAAQAMAARIVKADTDDGQRLARGFRLCVARPPTEFESGRLGELLAAARNAYQADAEAAKKLTNRHRPEDVSEAEAAAWVTVSRAILNLDEFIMRE